MSSTLRPATRLMLSFLLSVAASTPALRVARSQTPEDTPRAALPSRLGIETRKSIERLIDSVRVSGLPTAPLVDKAAEGVLKGAEDKRILAAVQSLARQLGEARTVLGPSWTPSLLVTTASALHAGVSTADVRRLASRASGDADRHALATALVTLVDLVAKRVPSSVAAASLAELMERRASESQYIALRSEVEQDILDGRSPEAAITARTRAHVRLLDDPAAAPVQPARRPPG